MSIESSSYSFVVKAKHMKKQWWLGLKKYLNN